MKQVIIVLLIGCTLGCTSTKKVTEKSNIGVTIAKEKYGIMIADLTQKVKDSTGLSHGVMVIKIFANYPANKAGITKGEVLTSINKKTIFDLENFYTIVSKEIYNYDQITVGVFRNKKVEKVILHMF